MNLETHKDEYLEFKRPDSCKPTRTFLSPNEYTIETKNYLSGKSIGRIYLSIILKNQTTSTASVAATHRARLLAKGIQVQDSALIPAPPPERFQTATLYWPTSTFKGTPIDTPQIIYNTASFFLQISLIGPEQKTLEPLWKLNQIAFSTIRDTIQIRCTNQRNSNSLLLMAAR